MRLWKSALWAILLSAANPSAAISQPLTLQQAREQARALTEIVIFFCKTVEDARGEKSARELGAELDAKAPGIWGKMFDLGGAVKGKISREQWEGLSQEEMAKQLEGDRKCREHNLREFRAMLFPPPFTPKVQPSPPPYIDQDLEPPPRRVARPPPYIDREPPPRREPPPTGPPRQSRVKQCCVSWAGPSCNQWYQAFGDKTLTSYSEVGANCYCAGANFPGSGTIPGNVQNCP
jgi:hypothetical protein